MDTHFDTTPIPRVNKGRLSNYVNKQVRLVAEVTSVNNGIATVETSDKGTVNIRMNPQSKYNSKFVEITGTVNNDYSITETSVVSFGTTFDMNNYETALNLMQQHPEIF